MTVAVTGKKGAMLQQLQKEHQVIIKLPGRDFTGAKALVVIKDGNVGAAFNEVRRLKDMSGSLLGALMSDVKKQRKAVSKGKGGGGWSKWNWTSGGSKGGAQGVAAAEGEAGGLPKGEAAPATLCKFDGRCTRPDCKFRHSKQEGASAVKGSGKGGTGKGGKRSGKGGRKGAKWSAAPAIKSEAQGKEAAMAALREKIAQLEAKKRIRTAQQGSATDAKRQKLE